MKGANHNVVGLHLNMFSGQRGRIATIKLRLHELLQPVTAGEGAFRTDLTIKEIDTSIYLIITPFSLIDKCVESNKGILDIWDKISGFATSSFACILFIVVNAGKIIVRRADNVKKMHPVVVRIHSFPDQRPFFIPYQTLEQGKLKKTETALLY